MKNAVKKRPLRWRTFVAKIILFSQLADFFRQNQAFFAVITLLHITQPQALILDDAFERLKAAIMIHDPVIRHTLTVLLSV